MGGGHVADCIMASSVGTSPDALWVHTCLQCKHSASVAENFVMDPPRSSGSWGRTFKCRAPCPRDGAQRPVMTW